MTYHPETFFLSLVMVTLNMITPVPLLNLTYKYLMMLHLGLVRYGQQPIQYVFDTDLADTILIPHDTHVHDLRFQNQEFCFNNKANVLD